MRQMLRLRSITVFLFSATVGVSLAAPTPSLAAQVPPGGRSYYAVIQGRLGTSGTNWVRLSYYNFRTDGLVDEGFWRWSSDNERNKIALPVHICDTCIQYAPYAFGTGGVSGTRQGQYSPVGTDGIVRVTWSDGSSESWTISPSRPLMTELSLRSSTAGASVGHAFGSVQSSTFANAPIGDTYSYMAANGLSSLSLAHFQRQWFRDLDTLTDDTQPYRLLGPGGGGTLCSATCLKAVSSADHYYFQDQSTPLPRNLAMETWKNTLDTSGDGCYQDGTDGTLGVTAPHVWAGITVVDDAGNWRGFVRAEASLYTDRNTDYMSVGWASTDTLGI